MLRLEIFAQIKKQIKDDLGHRFKLFYITMGSSRSIRISKILFLSFGLTSLVGISFATWLSLEMFEIFPSSPTLESEVSPSNSEISMTGDEYSGCYGSYCRSSRDEFFIKAEEKFIADMGDGLHTKEYTEGNKCKTYHISSIAYGFSAVEHGNGDSNIANITNNITSLKESTRGYQYMWKKENGKYKGYVIYPNKFEALLDFMHLYKYGYGCYLGEKRVVTYKDGIGASTEDKNFQRYYRNLIKYIESFENRQYADLKV